MNGPGPSRALDGAGGGCPSESTLIVFASGGASDVEIAEHAARCAECRREIDRLREDFAFESGVRDLIGSGGGGAMPIVPGYAIVREIHRGGQGVVYRAVQQSTRREAAVKLLLGGTLATSRQKHRFEREIEIASNLRHPNIVTLYEGFALADGRLGYAMELVDGVPIDRWSAAADPGDAGSRRAALEKMAKIARAVQYAHGRGVIHRDLKPSNILIGADGEPRVLDFGLARQSSVLGAADEPVTLSGEFAGTPEYSSPEQVEGRAEDVDARADVYALGVVLYKLVCGCPPYDVSGPLRRVFENISWAEPEPPGEAAARNGRPPVDTDLATILGKVLAKDRERRYQTAEALARDIELYLAHKPIEARRDSVWYVIATHLKRRRREAVLAGIAAALVAAGVLALTVLSVRAGESAKREALAREQREEESLRAQAVSLVLKEVLPPPGSEGVGEGSRPGARFESSLDELRQALDTGWLCDRPALAAHVQGVLSDLYALRGTNAGYYGEAAARNAKLLTAMTHGPDDERTLVAQEAEAAAMLARFRVVEARELAERLSGEWSRRGPEGAERVAAMKILAARAQLMQGDAAGTAARLRAILDERGARGGADDTDSATAWYTLAQALHRSGDPGGACAAARRAVVARMSLMRDVDPDVAEAVGFLAEMRRSDASTPGPPGEPSPEGLAELAGALERAWTRRETDPLLGRGDGLLALKASLFGERSAEVAETLCVLGTAASKVPRPELAADFYARAASILETPAAGGVAAVNAYASSAVQYDACFRPDRAAEMLASSLRLLLEIPEGRRDATVLAAVERDLALRRSLEGRFAEAEEHYKSSQARFEALLGHQGHVVATCMTRYADMLLRAGRAAEALGPARAGFEMGAGLESTPRDQRFSMHTTLGLALIANGQPGEAAQILERGAALAGSWSPGGAGSRINLGLSEMAWALSCAHRLAGHDADARRWRAEAERRWTDFLPYLTEAQVSTRPPTPTRSFPIPELAGSGLVWDAGASAHENTSTGTGSPPTR